MWLEVRSGDISSILMHTCIHRTMQIMATSGRHRAAVSTATGGAPTGGGGGMESSAFRNNLRKGFAPLKREKIAKSEF